MSAVARPSISSVSGSSHPARNFWQSLRAWSLAHSTLILLSTVLLVALVLRLAFTFRSPVFVTKDSLEYVQPGYGLVFGQGFELAQRRTPVYPAFIAAVMALTGQDLSAIAFVQHLLGVATAGMVFAIGCLAAGPLVGAIAGLLFALSSPQLIYEHYIITEPVFIFFLVASALAMIVAARRDRWGWYAVAGVLIGVGALTLPVAQVLLPLVPIYLWLVLRSWRRAALGTLVVWAVTALLLVPWSLRNQREYGTAETTSTGRFLDLAFGKARAELRVLRRQRARPTRREPAAPVSAPDCTGGHEQAPRAWPGVPASARRAGTDRGTDGRAPAGHRARGNPKGSAAVPRWHGGYAC